MSVNFKKKSGLASFCSVSNSLGGFASGAEPAYQYNRNLPADPFHGVEALPIISFIALERWLDHPAGL